jgi:hypothetical protein
MDRIWIGLGIDGIILLEWMDESPDKLFYEKCIIYYV